MSLTREQIENWRKIVLSHWAADSSGKWLEREESKRQANALCDMALSALPAGHVAVPREPTEAMILAYRDAIKTDTSTSFYDSAIYRYKAMLAAAEAK